LSQWHSGLCQKFPLTRSPLASDLQKTLCFQWFSAFRDFGISQAKDVLSEKNI
jgi:hypothetical protein